MERSKFLDILDEQGKDAYYIALGKAVENTVAKHVMSLDDAIEAVDIVGNLRDIGFPMAKIQAICESNMSENVGELLQNMSDTGIDDNAKKILFYWLFPFYEIDSVDRK